MMEKRIAVPEGMLRAAWHAQLPADNPTFEWDEGDEMNRKFYRRIFEAALLWLSENPIVPTLEQHMEISGVVRSRVDHNNLTMWDFWAEWQRRMFLAPEPKVPEVVKESPEIVALLICRMNEYSAWLISNLDRMVAGEPPLPRLEWDKPGRKIPTYGDINHGSKEAK